MQKKNQKDNSITDSDPIVNVIPPSANPINIAIPTVTAQLPTIVAIADQNSVPCLRALAANKQTILIPQVAYTYSTTVSPAVQETPPKQTQQANGSQVLKSMCSCALYVMCSFCIRTKLIEKC